MKRFFTTKENHDDKNVPVVNGGLKDKLSYYTKMKQIIYKLCKQKCQQLKGWPLLIMQLLKGTYFLDRNTISIGFQSAQCFKDINFLETSSVESATAPETYPDKFKLSKSSSFSNTLNNYQLKINRKLDPLKANYINQGLMADNGFKTQQQQHKFQLTLYSFCHEQHVECLMEMDKLFVYLSISMWEIN
ncbi:hypothetical protein FF38_06303 [Lucilia cuprina]|uniref:Uncharacterized protein n=1 Tax=Lucilia cuprina TaxID=7375 RepID=A0A0L0C7T6_LUCCU|nr:hypothetical protein FF38_06303 [Lucilia cuprina]